MSNSSLTSYTKLSPCCGSRNGHKISKITIHHMAGDLSIEQCGSIFANPDSEASANYGIDSDGRIALYVDESKRSWASANRDNDQIAVTIEVANDEYGGNWHVSDKALESTIKLCADICKRNNIKELNFTGNANGNLTMHKYFMATLCPGPYLESKFPYIAERVNKILKGEDDDMTYYKTLKDVPSWGQPAIKKLMDKGALQGTGNGEINVSEDLVRMATILNRLGVYDK